MDDLAEARALLGKAEKREADGRSGITITPGEALEYLADHERLVRLLKSSAPKWLDEIESLRKVAEAARQAVSYLGYYGGDYEPYARELLSDALAALRKD